MAHWLHVYNARAHINANYSLGIIMESTYCLITPAYNETEHIDNLVNSVIHQNMKPSLWVIVNDGSSDDTGTKIDKYAEDHSFIRVIHLSRDHVESYYSRKIVAFNAGYQFLEREGIIYQYLGNLDADITMRENYYSNILKEFVNDNALGIAGGRYVYPHKGIQPILHETMVPGSALMFRKECFEAIGGYIPLKYGAEDTLACIMARVQNWKVRMFPEYIVIQHRLVGSTGGMRMCSSRFRQGLSEYDIGYHPLFAFLKFIKRVFAEKPYIFSSSCRYLGYLFGMIFLKRRMTPKTAITLLRKEQLSRIFQ